MIQGKKVLGVIPARGGSKGVPGKNVRIVAGKPLIAWSIDEAKKSKYLDRLILSSDDAEIIKIAKAWGCEVPFIRPATLAQDDTPSVDLVLHAVNALPGYDYIVLLQPTSPLRISQDIDKCIEMCLEFMAPSCVSVTIPDKSPYLMFTSEDRKLHPLLNCESFFRRQDLPKVLALNGAVYVANVDWLREETSFVGEHTIAYEMPKLRSLDVDEEMDFKILQCLLKDQ